MDIPSILIGAGAVVGLYFVSLCVTKGIPAAWAFIKSKLSGVEAAIVADVQKDIATLKTDVTAIKAKVGL